jgi:hypothetical protein
MIIVHNLSARRADAATERGPLVGGGLTGLRQIVATVVAFLAKGDTD